MQPFGQVPAIDDDGLVLFDVVRIVMQLGQRSEALMPRDETAQEHVRTWMLAALNTIEPPIMMLNVIDMQPGGVQAGAIDLRHGSSGGSACALDNLSPSSASASTWSRTVSPRADLLMTTVLRILRTTDLVSQRRTLDAYKQRHEARPAFQKALADQMEAFAKHAPTSG
jgi:glutathione S-transferase